MATAGTALPPLSMYLHLPWCVRKCPYCDFNSHTAGEQAPKRRYLDALSRDLQLEAASGRAAERPLQSLFLGGGTPSLFDPAQIGEILASVRQHFSLPLDAEVTMEANPGTLECGNLAEYRAAGVNRLSLGAQSFNRESLHKLGRIHGPEEIENAYREAQTAGFNSVNLDLMFALPGQDMAMAMIDLGRAIELAPAHISWYQLTLEPNTVFFSKPPAHLPDDDLAWDIQESGQQLLHRAGYERYEISAYARPGYRCRHNLNYWSFGDYLAIGAGAHGKYTAPDGCIYRYTKPAHPLSYIENAESGRLEGSCSPVSGPDIGFEYMLNVLRLPQGFSESEFRSRTGQPFDAVVAGVETACRRNLMEQAGSGQWRPTAMGLRFLNDLQAGFLRSE
jgi:putative oxygen-independent coproporphyrinogen III oxidase